MTALKKEQQQWCVWVGQAGIDGKILTLKKDCTLFRLTLALPWTAKTTCPSLKKNIGTSSIIFNAATIFLPTRRAPCNCVNSCLESVLSGRFISRRTEILWHVHSPDLSPLDYWLWGLLEKDIGEEKPKNIAQLKLLVKAKAERIEAGQCTAQSKISGKDLLYAGQMEEVISRHRCKYFLNKCTEY